MSEDYGLLVSDIRRHLKLLDRSYEAALFQFHAIGLRLKDVETAYGEGTIDRLAADVGRNPSFLYRARQLAEMFPEREGLEGDIEARRKTGVRPSITYYCEEVLPDRGRFWLWRLEQRAMRFEADAEEAKAKMPEGDQEEIEGITTIVRETRLALHQHVDEGAMDAYVTWLKMQPCILCGGGNPCDAAHLPRAKSVGGDRLLSVCHAEHMELHQVGWEKFLERRGGAKEVIERLLWVLGDYMLAAYSRRGVFLEKG